MSEHDDAPLAHRSTEELLAISRFLAEHIQSLERQRAAIDAEVHLRGDAVTARLPSPSPTATATASLDYEAPDTRHAAAGAIGDPYADHARHYALRAALVLGAALLAALGVLALLSLVP